METTEQHEHSLHVDDDEQGDHEKVVVVAVGEEPPPEQATMSEHQEPSTQAAATTTTEGHALESTTTPSHATTAANSDTSEEDEVDIENDEEVDIMGGETDQPIAAAESAAVATAAERGTPEDIAPAIVAPTASTPSHGRRDGSSSGSKEQEVRRAMVLLSRACARTRTPQLTRKRTRVEWLRPTSTTSTQVARGLSLLS